MRRGLIILLWLLIAGLLFTAVDALMCGIALGAGCLMALVHAVIKGRRE